MLAVAARHLQPAGAAPVPRRAEDGDDERLVLLDVGRGDQQRLRRLVLALELAEGVGGEEREARQRELVEEARRVAARPQLDLVEVEGVDPRLLRDDERRLLHDRLARVGEGEGEGRREGGGEGCGGGW